MKVVELEKNSDFNGGRNLSFLNKTNGNKNRAYYCKEKKKKKKKNRKFRIRT